MANLIRQRKAHLSGLGGFPHERLHQETFHGKSQPTVSPSYRLALEPQLRRYLIFYVVLSTPISMGAHSSIAEDAAGGCASFSEPF
ncbi:hypothetical protein [Moorena sp. SIO3A2]|uniref:hypothetical protein n=1 Tax=Moorena sp. SIO3A2 TaxID=2607841 RepID=UPI0013B73E50|nr:hypothetical protein [Moorena sp. SIO3A2]NER87080.1 hypothetical protein [Moorena sp. SIO3A2]